jgi:hypothetical protein
MSCTSPRSSKQCSKDAMRSLESFRMRLAVFAFRHACARCGRATCRICKLVSSVKILERDESVQKALFCSILRVFTVSCDSASHTGDLFHMTFAKLSEGSSSITFDGCDQLLLAPRSRSANGCGSALRRKKCSHHYGGPSLSSRSCQLPATSSFFPFHPLADVLRAVLQLHPIRLAIS